MSQRLDRLWAPWRLSYIQKQTDKKQKSKKKKPPCVFCVAAQARIANEKNLVLFKNKEFFIIMNKFPYNPYHLMVIPNQHLGDLDELDNHVWLNINFAAKKCIAILKKEIKSPGFNIGMNLGAAAGAGIAEHLHLHIIPRWFGDTNFMPLIAETKAIPTHNLAVYRRLKPLFKNFSL